MQVWHFWRAARVVGVDRSTGHVWFAPLRRQLLFAAVTCLVYGAAAAAIHHGGLMDLGLKGWIAQIGFPLAGLLALGFGLSPFERRVDLHVEAGTIQVSGPFGLGGRRVVLREARFESRFRTFGTAEVVETRLEHPEFGSVKLFAAQPDQEATDLRDALVSLQQGEEHAWDGLAGSLARQVESALGDWLVLAATLLVGPIAFLGLLLT